MKMKKKKKNNNNNNNENRKNEMKLGTKQKHIINQIVENDYYILKTFDTTDNSITISLIDEWGNHDRDLTNKELNALLKKDILISKGDVSMCLQLIQEKFTISEDYLKQMFL